MIRLVQNPLHPYAAYLDVDRLTQHDDLNAVELPEGYDRVIATLPFDHDYDLSEWSEMSRSGVFNLAARAVDCPNARVVAASQMDQWLNAHWDYYRDCKSDNLPEKPTNLRHTFGQSIEDGTAAFIGGGFASLRGMRGGVAEAGWIAGNRAEINEAIDWCLTQADRIGARVVQFDAEDTDPFLWSALMARGKPAETYVTYQKTN
ncbi:hypothetical protein BVC71_00840 [Marivivens niveibacter]|uniref:Uncharacterized protein n=1 Tax=Marivivens niveibacter TaxID=1930667 RepID=A0A251X074_9RHOB|nr:hypothetical protein [Marivivens niveibacter]OUD10097.1 hypothetical protein BVC71_00840 [Marivivens niveibacter]